MVDTKKYCFIHIPKNAGTAIVKSLNREIVWYVGHHSIGVQSLSLPKDIKCFAVVRNPFARLLSWFMYHKGSEFVNVFPLKVSY